MKTKLYAQGKMVQICACMYVLKRLKMLGVEVVCCVDDAVTCPAKAQ